MARPNFNLIATINKYLHGVTFSQHTVNSKRTANFRFSSIWDDYDHAVNVSVPGYGMFEFRWNNDRPELESIPRRWLATQVYYFKARNQIHTGKAA